MHCPSVGKHKNEYDEDDSRGVNSSKHESLTKLKETSEVQNNNHRSDKGCNPRVIEEIIIYEIHLIILNEAIIENGNDDYVQD